MESNRSSVNDYITSFRKELYASLIDGISIKSVVYQYKKGYVIVFTLKQNDTDSTEFKKPVDTLAEALANTKLFKRSVKNSAGIPEKFRAILPTGNKIVIIRQMPENMLTAEAAKADVKRAIEKIFKKPEESRDGDNT